MASRWSVQLSTRSRKICAFICCKYRNGSIWTIGIGSIQFRHERERPPHAVLRVTTGKRKERNEGMTKASLILSTLIFSNLLRPLIERGVRTLMTARSTFCEFHLFPLALATRNATDKIQPYISSNDNVSLLGVFGEMSVNASTTTNKFTCRRSEGEQWARKTNKSCLNDPQEANHWLAYRPFVVRQ